MPKSKRHFTDDFLMQLQRDGKRSEYVLDAAKPERLFIPKQIPTGLENVSREEAWLINYPDPPYDPRLLDEQVEYTQEELAK